MSDPSHPVNAALVKEFGVYPPGCFVKLISGETAMVVQRGPSVMASVVAALSDVRGRPHPTPVRRETTERCHAVASVVPARNVHCRFAAQDVAVMALA